jgi:hypothetical protein
MLGNERFGHTLSSYTANWFIAHQGKGYPLFPFLLKVGVLELHRKCISQNPHENQTFI